MRDFHAITDLALKLQARDGQHLASYADAMVQEDLELETDLGEATVVYEAPDGKTSRTTVPNEHAVYVQDHWTIKVGEDDEGNDLVRRIPARRVYHVERSVEEFEDEIGSIRNRVQALADEIGTKLPFGDWNQDEDTDGRDADDTSAEDDAREDGDGGDD